MVRRRTGLLRLGSFRSLGVFASRSLRRETCFRRFLLSRPVDRSEPSAQPVRESRGLGNNLGSTRVMLDLQEVAAPAMDFVLLVVLVPVFVTFSFIKVVVLLMFW